MNAWILTVLVVAVNMMLMLWMVMKWGSVGDSDVKWLLRGSILGLLCMAVTIVLKWGWQ